MTGLLLVACSVMLARRLQTHDHQSLSSNNLPDTPPENLPTNIPGQYCIPKHFAGQFPGNSLGNSRSRLRSAAHGDIA